MDNHEETEEYTHKDFAKDVALETGKAVLIQVAAVAVLAGAGYGLTKFDEFKKKRAAKKALKAEK